MQKLVFFTTLFVCFSFYGIAQTASKPKKVYCNPLVLGSIPKKALSIQYEYQTRFSTTYTEKYQVVPTPVKQNIDNVQGIRVGYYKALIAKPKTFMTLDVGYWFSKFNVANSNTLFEKALDGSNFHNISVATNIFKPLNKKNFFLINASVEANGNGSSFSSLGAKNILGGGAIIYGWKKGVTRMTGVGVLRAYRMGRVIHVPAFLWNQNFNAKWGIESLWPARAIVRYAANKKTILLTGFDLEGTQYAFGSVTPALNNSFFQRGEIKTRVGLDSEIRKNVRLTANAGLRIMGRMNWADNYNGKGLLVENDAKPNFFMNLGFSIVNIKTKKRSK
jgi:Domain of unknown function (DUF6268)